MNCQKLALRTIQSDGGGRLRSRQLREGVKIPAPPLYNDVGHAFHSDFFYSLTHCFQAKKKMPLQTNRSVDQVSVGKQAQILDTHILLWCKEVLPRKLSCILLHLHHCLDQHTSSQPQMPCLDLHSSLSLVIIITATHAMHIYYMPQMAHTLTHWIFMTSLGFVILEL